MLLVLISVAALILAKGVASSFIIWSSSCVVALGRLLLRASAKIAKSLKLFMGACSNFAVATDKFC